MHCWFVCFSQAGLVSFGFQPITWTWRHVVARCLGFADLLCRNFDLKTGQLRSLIQCAKSASPFARVSAFSFRSSGFYLSHHLPTGKLLFLNFWFADKGHRESPGLVYNSSNLPKRQSTKSILFAPWAFKNIIPILNTSLMHD